MISVIMFMISDGFDIPNGPAEGPEVSSVSLTRGTSSRAFPLEWCMG